jgi:hypothetical protein
MLNFLTGDSSLRRVRDRGRQFAQELYDPNVFAPQREMASRQATMGIDQGGIRSGALAQLSRVDNDADIFGGSAGRMVGMMGQQNLAQGRNITDMETRLGIADQQARLQGQQQLAEVQSRQLQTGAMRDAAMTEADMMYQAERSSRRQALAGTAIGLGTMGAMGMFPGLKGGALALINKLTGATGLPEGAAMSADVDVLPNPIGAMDRPTSAFESMFEPVTGADAIDYTPDNRFARTRRNFTPTTQTQASVAQPPPTPQAPVVPPEPTLTPTTPEASMGEPLGEEATQQRFELPSYLFRDGDMSTAPMEGIRPQQPQQEAEGFFRPGRSLTGPLGGPIERGIGGFFGGLGDLGRAVVDPDTYIGAEERARRRMNPVSPEPMFDWVDIEGAISRFSQPDDVMSSLQETLSSIDLNDDEALNSLRNRYIEMGMNPEDLDVYIRNVISQLANAQ